MMAKLESIGTNLTECLFLDKRSGCVFKNDDDGCRWVNRSRALTNQALTNWVSSANRFQYKYFYDKPTNNNKVRILIIQNLN